MPETMQSSVITEPRPTPVPSSSGQPHGFGPGSLVRRLRGIFSGPTPRDGCRCSNPLGEVGEGAELVLDVRGLSLEGQTGRTLERMEVLPADHRLRHVNTLVSWPLLALLDGRGYRYRLVGRKEGAVHILIWGATPGR